MDRHRVTVATITWVREAGEAETLDRSLAKLAETGLPIAVADRGTNLPFADGLPRLPGVRVTRAARDGLVPQALASLELAASCERPFILYTEPDKEQFFRERLLDFIDAAPDGERVGCVLAARSPESLATFPAMQRYTEGVINRLAGEVIGLEGDYSYGPFLIRRTLLQPLLDTAVGLGWGWRHRAFVLAARDGYEVTHVPGDFTCPPDQREEGPADRMHRMQQLSDNIRGLLDALGPTR